MTPMSSAVARAIAQSSTMALPPCRCGGSSKGVSQGPLFCKRRGKHSKARAIRCVALQLLAGTTAFLIGIPEGRAIRRREDPSADCPWQVVVASPEAVALARADQAQHRVTITFPQGLQRRPAPEDGVGCQQ
jgi:hypothetical protein